MVKKFEKGKSVRQLLTKAEENMLKISMARMEMKDGYNVLDIGCGWGSATFWILTNYPKSKVVAISNSNQQREFIEKKAQEKGFSDRLLVIKTNVKYFTAASYGEEVQKFLGKTKFDRLHSCEMFEHMRNWERLLNIFREDWVEENGGMFLHYFVHKDRAYTYSPDTWMGKYFFTGGIMPSFDLLPELDKSIGTTWKIDASYKVNGRHYAKTAEAWLKLFDLEGKKIFKLFVDTYGKDQAKVWYNRWRIFFISVSEFFGGREGTEWFVANYYLKPWTKEDDLLKE